MGPVVIVGRIVRSMSLFLSSRQGYVLNHRNLKGENSLLWDYSALQSTWQFLLDMQKIMVGGGGGLNKYNNFWDSIYINYPVPMEVIVEENLRHRPRLILNWENVGSILPWEIKAMPIFIFFLALSLLPLSLPQSVSGSRRMASQSLTQISTVFLPRCSS